MSWRWSILSKMFEIIAFFAYGYVPLVVNTSRSFPHSWLITGFVTRLTRRVPLVEQELLHLPEHLSSPPVFNGIRVTWSLVLCVCYVCPFVLFLFWPLCLKVLSPCIIYIYIRKAGGSLQFLIRIDMIHKSHSWCMTF